MIVVEILLIMFAAYLVAGIVFAIAFAIRGVEVVDEGAHGSSWGFRLIITPGVILLWPVMLKKWMNATKKNHEL